MKGTIRARTSGKTRKPAGEMPKRDVSKHAKARRQRAAAKRKKR